MWMISNLIQRTSLPLVEAMVSFTEARHGVIAENIANIDTPGYRTKQLDPAAFQAELRKATKAKRHPVAAVRIPDHESRIPDPVRNTQRRSSRLRTSCSRMEPTHGLSARW